MFDKLEEWIEAHMPEAKVRVECTGNLLCQRVGIRHKTHCLSRTVPIATYVNGIKAA